jgi:hypothetical protein
MLAWLKKIFIGKKIEETNAAVTVDAPATPEKTAAESMTGAKETTEDAADEASSEDMK